METDLKKYYQPEIEEFHIGFEYEWLNDEGTWIKEDSPIEISKENFDEQTYGLRVKYLDQQDIEDCGWEYSNTSREIEYYNIEEISLYHDIIDHEISIYKIDCDWESCEFRGTVKNISELKKLMKQLNITKE